MVRLESPSVKRNKLSLGRRNKLASPTSSRLSEDQLLQTNNLGSSLTPVEQGVSVDAENSSYKVRLKERTQDGKIMKQNDVSSNMLTKSTVEKQDASALESMDTSEKTTVPISRLQNFGNTCFVNSILYVLRYTPQFISCLHQLVIQYEEIKEIIPAKVSENLELASLKQLYCVYVAMRKNEDALIAENRILGGEVDVSKEVNSFLDLLRQMNSLFEENEQHDSHEFFVTLIASFSSCLQKLKILKEEYIQNPHIVIPQKKKRKKQKCLFTKKKRRGKKNEKASDIHLLDFEDMFKESKYQQHSDELDKKDEGNLADAISSVFQGKVCEVNKCMECEEVKKKEEEFLDLKVPLVTSAHESSDEESDCGSVTLLQCLKEETKLYEENKFFCNNCLHLNEAKLSYKVILAPSILLLHLSWLSVFSGIASATKTKTQIDVPLVLDSSSYSEVFSDMTDYSYLLYAAVMHIGISASDGHYVSFVRISNSLTVQDKTLQNNKNVSKILPRLPDVSTLSETKNCVAKELRESWKMERSSGETEVDLISHSRSWWFLFDDDDVLPLDVNNITTYLPYVDYLGPTAIPYMLFYRRI